MEIFKVSELWDNILYIIYNIIVILKYYLFDKWKYNKYLKKSKQLKNIHCGESCYIVLNGPSIEKHDLTKLTSKYTICSNYFYLSKYCDQINPSYYCIIDSDTFLNERMEHIHNIYNKCRDSKFIFHNCAINKISEDNKKRTYFVFGKHMPTIFKVRENLAGLCSAFVNVSYFCIITAIYMGFKKIYILGNDFPPGGLTHCYVEPDSLQKRINDKAYKNKYKNKNDTCSFHYYYYLAQLQSFYTAKEAAKKGVEIFNLNNESYIRAYNFIDYEVALRDDD